MGLEAAGKRDDEEGGESERAGTHATSASLRLATTSYSRKEEGKEREVMLDGAKRILAPTIPTMIYGDQLKSMYVVW